MASKDKSKHKFGDWLLKQEDDAGFYSSKREYIANLREGYLTSKVGIFRLLLPMMLCIIIGVIFNNKIVWTICIVCAGIITFIMLTRVHNKNKVSEENYIRTEFDKTYGSRKYDEIMKKIERKSKVKK